MKEKLLRLAFFLLGTGFTLFTDHVVMGFVFICIYIWLCWKHLYGK